MNKLGKKAIDKVTGFEGIIISKVYFLFGCAQYGLAAKVNDGKVGDTLYFDEGRIEIIDDGITAASVSSTKPGGVNRDAPKH